MSLRSVNRLLWLGIGLALGVASLGLCIGWFWPAERAPVASGLVVADRVLPHPPASPAPAENVTAVNLAPFVGLALQRPVVDVPVVAAPVQAAAPVVMVQLPPDIVFTGVMVGSTPEKSTAFLKPGASPVEVLQVGQRMKSRPEVEVTAIESQSVTLRYQGQLFPLQLPKERSLIQRSGE